MQKTNDRSDENLKPAREKYNYGLAEVPEIVLG